MCICEIDVPNSFKEWIQNQFEKVIIHDSNEFIQSPELTYSFCTFYCIVFSNLLIDYSFIHSFSLSTSLHFSNKQTKNGDTSSYSAST